MESSGLGIERCFKNPAVQAIHRYADFVLFLLLTAIAWWLVNIDARVTQSTNNLQVIHSALAGTDARNDETLRRLTSIDQRLGVIDQRLYALMGLRVPQGQQGP